MFGFVGAGHKKEVLEMRIACFQVLFAIFFVVRCLGDDPCFHGFGEFRYAGVADWFRAIRATGNHAIGIHETLGM